MSSNLILLVVYTQLTLIPILGMILMGIRREREQHQRLLVESLKALRFVGVARGNRSR